MGGGGGRSWVAERGGVLFSLSFAARTSSSETSCLRFFVDFGRDKSPLRLVVDFVFLALMGEPGSFSLAVLVESFEAKALVMLLKVLFCGDGGARSRSRCPSPRWLYCCEFCCRSPRVKFVLSSRCGREEAVSETGPWLPSWTWLEKDEGSSQPSEGLLRCPMRDRRTETDDLVRWCCGRCGGRGGGAPWRVGAAGMAARSRGETGSRVEGGTVRARGRVSRMF